MRIKQITFAALLAAASSVQAQNTYLNDRLTSTDQLNGSARFVGMGGALGALGADLSVISSNPAGIGLYRKSDIGMTFGAVIPNGNGWDMDDKTTYNENLSRASFDQFGGVLSLRTGSTGLKRLNIAFNYQKKLNFNQGFFADNNNLGGLSQMTQLAELVNGYYLELEDDALENNLACLAKKPYMESKEWDEYYLSKGVDEQGNEYRYNNAYSTHNNYTRHQRGALKAYDINFSMNFNDRVYVGTTLGIDELDYREWNEYAEFGGEDGGLNHSLYNDTEISGVGVNGKFGIIARPFEFSSFRLGLAVETPTWYRMENSTLFNLDKSDQPESYMEYTLRTPWKVRLSAGHTVGSVFAWGVEYEYANYAKTKMGYPAYDAYSSGGQFRTADWDMAMNELTRNTLKGQHTLRLGVEVNPLRKLAVRAGYNYISGRFADNVGFDQYSIDSRAMDYATNTEYMRLGDTNILTAGLGYKGKLVYVDLTYQFRAQRGDFYAFDATEQGGALRPVDVNLNRHQLMLGVGVKL